jgi:hypothetical protein
MLYPQRPNPTPGRQSRVPRRRLLRPQRLIHRPQRPRQLRRHPRPPHASPSVQILDRLRRPRRLPNRHRKITWAWAPHATSRPPSTSSRRRLAKSASCSMGEIAGNNAFETAEISPASTPRWGLAACSTSCGTCRRGGGAGGVFRAVC